MSALVAYLGWLGLRVVELGKQYADLASRFSMRDRECGERLEWMRRMEDTMKEMVESASEAAKNSAITATKIDFLVEAIKQEKKESLT